MLRTTADLDALLAAELAPLAEHVCAFWDGSVPDGIGIVSGTVSADGQTTNASGKARRRTLRWSLARDAENWPALTLLISTHERGDGIDLSATFAEPDECECLVHASLASALVARIYEHVGAAGGSTAGSGYAVSAAREWTEAGRRALVSEPPTMAGSLGEAMTRPRRFAR